MANANGRLFFVSNLPVETTEEDLKRFFSPQIKLIECTLTKTLNGISNCHGYIRMDCNGEKLEQYLKNRRFQKKQLEIDAIEEDTNNGNKYFDATGSNKEKEKKHKNEMVNGGRRGMHLYKAYGNGINENKYTDTTDTRSIKNVNIINENGTITKYGFRILSNMNMSDLIILIEKIQSLIRACPQTAIKLLTENKAVFYSLVHALFLLGIINIEINPLKKEELKKAHFWKIKNRFQYLCFEEGNEENKTDVSAPILLQSDENRESAGQRKNKRNFDFFEAKRGREKGESYVYNKKKRGQTEGSTEIADIDNGSFRNFEQGYDLHGKYINGPSGHLKNTNDDVIINSNNNGNLSNINDISANSNSIYNVYNSSSTNNNISSISRSNNVNYNIKERTSNVIMSKTGKSRNLIYTSNAAAVGANSYSKGVYSFNTGGGNIMKKYKKEEQKTLYKMNDAFGGESEFLMNKRNNSSRLYSNKNFVSRDYGSDPYGDNNSKYDVSNYKNSKPMDYTCNAPKSGGNLTNDPFAEKGEIDKKSLSSRKFSTNTFGTTYFNENVADTEVASVSAIASGGKDFLKKTNTRNVDSRKYSSGLYKKKMNKSIINHNKSINRVVMNQSPPTFYSNCYSNKKSKHGNNTLKNINISMDSVHGMGSKVMYRGKFKEIYGGKFKNKIANYVNTSTNIMDEPNSKKTKIPYTSFYNTEEERSQGVEFGNEVYENDQSAYNVCDSAMYERGNYGGNQIKKKGNTTGFSSINSFSNAANFNDATNLNNVPTYSNTPNVNTQEGNSVRSFNAKEIEHDVNPFSFGNAPIYNQNNSSNAFNDTKNAVFSTESSRREGSEFNISYVDEETEVKQKMEKPFTRELGSNEIKDMCWEDLYKNKFGHFNQADEEKKSKKQMAVFSNAQSNITNTFVSGIEDYDSFNRTEEVKERGVSPRKEVALRQEGASKQDSAPKQGYAREVKGRERNEKMAFSPLMKNENDGSKNKQELNVRSRKHVSNKSKITGNSRRCINIIDRKNADGSNKGSIVKVKSIEVIEKKDPLIRKKKEQPLINTHLKMILNKLKIALGAIPNAPDDLVNEVINENNMLNNIIKSKYEDMLKWPNEQILRVLSIRKTLKQRGFPITDII